MAFRNELSYGTWVWIGSARESTALNKSTHKRILEAICCYLCDSEEIMLIVLESY